MVPCASDGTLHPGDIAAAIGPRTRSIVLDHASNVCGTLMSVAKIGEITRRRGLLLLVDAATTAGALPIDLERDRIDLLAFTGHKSLYGPAGTGGLALGPRVGAAHLPPRKRGGTGSHSESEEHPPFLPDAFGSGTPNAVGLAGLAAGVRFVPADDEVQDALLGLVTAAAVPQRCGGSIGIALIGDRGQWGIEGARGGPGGRRSRGRRRGCARRLPCPAGVARSWPGRGGSLFRLRGIDGGRAATRSCVAPSTTRPQPLRAPPISGTLARSEAVAALPRAGPHPAPGPARPRVAHEPDILAIMNEDC